MCNFFVIRCIINQLLTNFLVIINESVKLHLNEIKLLKQQAQISYYCTN